MTRNWTFSVKKILQELWRVEVDSEKYPTKKEAWEAIEKGDFKPTQQLIIGYHAWNPVFLRYEDFRIENSECEICGKIYDSKWLGRCRCKEHKITDEEAIKLAEELIADHEKQKEGLLELIERFRK